MYFLLPPHCWYKPPFSTIKWNISKKQNRNYFYVLHVLDFFRFMYENIYYNCKHGNLSANLQVCFLLWIMNTLLSIMWQLHVCVHSVELHSFVYHDTHTQNSFIQWMKMSHWAWILICFEIFIMNNTFKRLESPRFIVI